MGYIIDNISYDDNLLILDDVFDMGFSIDVVLWELREKCWCNMLDIIKVGMVYYKFGKCKIEWVLDYYVYLMDDWFVFLYELYGLMVKEICEGKFESIGCLFWDDLM